MLAFLSEYLPDANAVTGKFIEPFVGGGAVYFHVQPKRALLADINNELIDLYRGICQSPGAVWRVYRNFPRGKRAYKRIRAVTTNDLSLIQKAARSLYLNRTCFKGMWRHNRQGRFNIGYGGESRRWSITRKDLFVISDLLSRASLKCVDFEPIIEAATPRDYLFIDPPYRPGDKEQTHDHYFAQQFTFGDHKRLAFSLRQADRRGVRWLMTTSAHPDILKLYRGFLVRNIPKGTSRRIGVLIKNSGEALISNSEK